MAGPEAVPGDVSGYVVVGTMIERPAEQGLRSGSNKMRPGTGGLRLGPIGAGCRAGGMMILVSGPAQPSPPKSICLCFALRPTCRPDRLTDRLDRQPQTLRPGSLREIAFACHAL